MGVLGIIGSVLLLFETGTSDSIAKLIVILLSIVFHAIMIFRWYGEMFYPHRMGKVKAAEQLLIQFARERLFSRKPVSGPPGALLNGLAEFLGSSKTYRECLQPAIADMQHEYFEALAAGRTMKAGWIRFRGCCAFWNTWGLTVVVNTFKVITKFMAG